MRAVVQDIRYAIRQLLRNPGFSLTAVLSLGLGIGATTAVFSVIYAVLINPFPYPTADRIVRLGVWTGEGQGRLINLNGPQIRQLRQSPVLDGVLVIDGWGMSVTGGDLPENINVDFLSGNSFHDLGMPMTVGRALAPSDSIEGQEPQPVCVISWKFWQSHFGGSPAALGKTLQLEHKNYTIVGVAPPRFTWYSAEVYLPLNITSDPGPIYMVDPLLKPGVSRSEANAALQPLLEEFARQTPKRFPQHFRMGVQGLNDWVIRSMGSALYLLFGAVGLLLLIGCGNVSILLLARGSARQHELAIRTAVGAGRQRILRQLLTESLVLAVAGAAFGVALAFALVRLILAILPKYSFAPEVAVQINLPVLFFSAGIALGTSILFGLLPAMRLSHPQIAPSMQDSARKVAGSVRSRRTHNALIAGQIALTLTLVAAACGALQTFAQLMHTPLGYDPHNVLPVWIPLPDNKFNTWAERTAYVDKIRTQLAEIPGVLQAAISTNATPPQNGYDMAYEVLGKPAPEHPTARVNLISPEYFPLLHIPLDRGRVWTEPENRTGAHFAVINETMARLAFPNGDAIGQSIRLPDIEARSHIVVTAPDAAQSWLQIIGVVADSRNDGLKRPVKPAIYVPNTLFMAEYSQVLLRTAVAPTSLNRAVRITLRNVNADQQTESQIEDLEQWLSEEPEWAQEHLVAWIFGGFAVLSLSLAAVGLYSVVSYSVAQRTNEFGIRMALGAQRSHVARLVFASTAISVGSGILAGLALTLGANRLLANWSGGTWNNPLILSGTVLLLAIVAVMACAVPVFRAVSVNPMTALRHE
jgi:predicted permease